MATASGLRSAMYSFRASRRSATAGRPKCKSEICARVVTNSDSTRTCPGYKLKVLGKQVKDLRYGAKLLPQGQNDLQWLRPTANRASACGRKQKAYELKC